MENETNEKTADREQDARAAWLEEIRREHQELFREQLERLQAKADRPRRGRKGSE